MTYYCRKIFGIGVWKNKYFDHFDKCEWEKWSQIAFRNGPDRD